MNPRVMIKSLPTLCVVAGVLGSPLGAGEAAGAVPRLVLDATGPLTRNNAEHSNSERAAFRASDRSFIVAGGFRQRFEGHSFGHFRGFGPFLGVYGPGNGHYAPGYTYEKDSVSPALPRPHRKTKRQAAAVSSKYVARRKAALKPAPRLTRSVATPPLAEIDPLNWGAKPTVSRGDAAPTPLGDATGGGRATFRPAPGGTITSGPGHSTGGSGPTPLRAGQSRGR